MGEAEKVQEAAQSIASVDSGIFLGLVAVIATTFVLIWGLSLFFLRNHPQLLRAFFAEGFAVRLSTIIAAAGVLSLFGKMDARVATLLSGIAGFVLGGVKNPGRRNTEMSERVMTDNDKEPSNNSE